METFTDNTDNTDTPTTPYRFRIRVSDEIFGCVRSPKTKEETLELLHRDLLVAFGEQYEIVEFSEISEEEWEAAAAEVNGESFAKVDTPKTLN